MSGRVRTLLSIAALSAMQVTLANSALAQASRFDALAKQPFKQNRPTEKAAETLKDELLFQRATQTYLWAMPLLNSMGMRDGFAQSFGAGYNTMAIWEKRLDAKTRITMIAFNDASWQPLVGANSYKVRLPPNIPTEAFFNKSWALPDFEKVN
ncbi:hypothetical protein [Cupriavidus oxalaticus]|uniref:hypothetical protein n=1 Tax=Cupriavidus oxalaticus TaxID=96344 RepID=UPI003178D233